MREDIKDYPGYVNTCFSPIPLGRIVNPVLEKMGKVEAVGAVESYPIDSLMTGNVRSGDVTPLDILEDYLTEQTESMVKYYQKANANQDYLKKQLARIAKAEEALEELRKSKTEVWLYLYECIKAAEKELGLAGNVTINFPLRFDVKETFNIDFINGEAQIWKR